MLNMLLQRIAIQVSINQAIEDSLQLPFVSSYLCWCFSIVLCLVLSVPSRPVLGHVMSCLTGRTSANTD